MPIEMIFFDFGYTLVYPNPDYLSACRSIAHAHGIAISDELLENGIKYANQIFGRKLENDIEVWISDESIHKYFNDFFSQIFFSAFVEEQLPHSREEARFLGSLVYQGYCTSKYWEIYDDVIPVLEMLSQQGYKLGIYSDWHSGLRKLVTEKNIHRYFDHIFSSSEFGVSKSQIGAFDKLISTLNINPKNAIYIGGNYGLDYKPSLDAGMFSILLNRKGGQVMEGINSIKKLDELFDILKKM